MSHHYGPSPYFVPPAPPGYQPNSRTQQYSDMSQITPELLYSYLGNNGVHQQAFPVPVQSNAHQWAQAAAVQQAFPFANQTGTSHQSMPTASVPIQNSIPPLMSINLDGQFTTPFHPSLITSGTQYAVAGTDRSLAIPYSLQQLWISQEISRQQQQLAIAQRMQLHHQPQDVQPLLPQSVLPVADELPNFHDSAFLTSSATCTRLPLAAPFPVASLPMDTTPMMQKTETIIENSNFSVQQRMPLSPTESARLPSVQPALSTPSISSVAVAPSLPAPALAPPSYTLEQVKQIRQLLASFKSSSIRAKTPPFKNKKREKKNAGCRRVVRKGQHPRGPTGVIVTNHFEGAMTDSAREWFEKRGRLPFKDVKTEPVDDDYPSASTSKLRRLKKKAYEPKKAYYDISIVNIVNYSATESTVSFPFATSPGLMEKKDQEDLDKKEKRQFKGDQDDHYPKEDGIEEQEIVDEIDKETEDNEEHLPYFRPDDRSKWEATVAELMTELKNDRVVP